MNTEQQRLTNLTARVDQLEAYSKTFTRVTTVLWLCLVILAILVITRAINA